AAAFCSVAATSAICAVSQTRQSTPEFVSSSARPRQVQLRDVFHPLPSPAHSKRLAYQIPPAELSRWPRRRPHRRLLRLFLGLKLQRHFVQQYPALQHSQSSAVGWTAL